MTPEWLSVTLYRCRGCSALFEKPVVVCPACLADTFDPQTVPGMGVLSSWTTIRKPPLAFRQHGAYDVAVVDLEAGLRVTGRIRSHEGQQVGDRVALIDKIDVEGEQINIFEVQV